MNISTNAIHICVLMLCSVLPVSCESAPEANLASITCGNRMGSDRSFVGFYSFENGAIPVPPADESQIDLVYYFDADDCTDGALIGHDDEPGWIYPLEPESWPSIGNHPPSPAPGDAETIVAITPLKREIEGLVFWVKSTTGVFTLVRVISVEPATCEELVAGATPTIEFEWMRATR